MPVAEKNTKLDIPPQLLIDAVATTTIAPYREANRQCVVQLLPLPSSEKQNHMCPNSRVEHRLPFWTDAETVRTHGLNPDDLPIQDSQHNRWTVPSPWSFTGSRSYQSIKISGAAFSNGCNSLPSTLSSALCDPERRILRRIFSRHDQRCKFMVIDEVAGTLLH